MDWLGYIFWGLFFGGFLGAAIYDAVMSGKNSRRDRPF